MNKELIADRDLTVTFGQMKTSHYDGWDETVSRYLQAVRSSCCRGGCGDVSFAKLQHGKTEVTMHHYYSKVRVKLMQVLDYSHSRNPPCAPTRTHGQIQAPREPPN
jgi:hypothetical protein